MSVTSWLRTQSIQFRSLEPPGSMWLGVLAPAPLRSKIRCSDQAEHRRRVESRLSDRERDGPTWRVSHVIDTAALTMEQAVAGLRVAAL